MHEKIKPTSSLHPLRGGGGGGGTLIVFEIAVDQQTMARARTPGAHWCPQDSQALIWSILPNHLILLKVMLWSALLVATSLLNTCI